VIPFLKTIYSVQVVTGLGSITLPTTKESTTRFYLLFGNSNGMARPTTSLIGM
jgi:hypothetical protein